jgi:subtilisin-like proprotein convertase family protein
MSKHEHGWTQRLARASRVTLVAGLLIGAGGLGVTGTASAKGDVHAEEIQVFSNTTAIAIPSNAQASPSAIAVSGFETPVADVNVSLNSLTHATASDLDILLVGPGGQRALIMSEAGDDAANDSPTFDDQARNQVPSGLVPLTSDTFQPTNYDFTSAPDTFAAPAPTNPSHGSALAVFNGTNPNGIWTLFIREQDAVPVETGTIAGGWRLTITSANGVPKATPDSFQAQAGKTLSVAGPGVLGNDSDPDGDGLVAILAGQPKQGSVSLQADGSFTYKSKKTAKGNDSFTYLAQDATGLRDLETVSIQIKKAKKKKGKK